MEREPPREGQGKRILLTFNSELIGAIKCNALPVVWTWHSALSQRRIRPRRFRCDQAISTLNQCTNGKLLLIVSLHLASLHPLTSPPRPSTCPRPPVESTTSPPPRGLLSWLVLIQLFDSSMSPLPLVHGCAHSKDSAGTLNLGQQGHPQYRFSH